MEVKPKIRIEIRRGLVSHITSNCDCEIQVIDWDVESGGGEIEYEPFSPDCILNYDGKVFMDADDEEDSDK